MLEEKQVSYRVSKVNMRSYGDKPAAFLAKVPSGLLPALELVRPPSIHCAQYF